MCRAWVRMALNDGLVDSYVDAIVGKSLVGLSLRLTEMNNALSLTFRKTVWWLGFRSQVGGSGAGKELCSAS